MTGRRILILTNRVPYPLKDGGALAMDAMIEGFRKEGWQVYLLAMNTSRHHVSKEKIHKLYPGIHKLDTVDVDNDIKWLATLNNFFFSTQPEHADRFTNAAFQKKLLSIIKHFKPDVIQMESIYLSVYLPVIKEVSNALTIQRLHNVEYQIWERLAKETSQPVKRFYLKNLAKRIRRFEMQIWSQFDLLLPITQADGDIIRKSGCRTPQVVTPFGITLRDSHIEVEEHWTAYHIGAMDWLPNIEAMDWFLNDIWPLVHKLMPRFQFSFAGRNMPERFFSKQGKGVHCMGEVKDADEFIADKKILIVPLRSGGGIRIKIMEAMATGKLVISTETGMQGIAAEPGVHYLMANTEQEFADAIYYAMHHKHKAENIATAGQQLLIEVYNQKNIMDGLLGKLLQLLGSQRKAITP
ncbi:glycosyltransferase family 4 protein [Taibaiella soli]|uniref:Glycosyltransferase n=1 Tax=Taibaiella soli TaxID=1649169 RepID=A0A2W2C311_9BACT|nr:glycosyltransferase family 4 protein [Taibaiella soli]PZF74493.1 hypothetical protein DN068_02640 [Taibaiella soli]